MRLSASIVSPKTNLSTYTQPIVQESQEAVLFSKGQIAGKLSAGKHTPSTENPPRPSR